MWYENFAMCHTWWYTYIFWLGNITARMHLFKGEYFERMKFKLQSYIYNVIFIPMDLSLQDWLMIYYIEYNIIY